MEDTTPISTPALPPAAAAVEPSPTPATPTPRSSIIPTKGRIVLVVIDSSGHPTERPAIITEVFTSECVNVHVFYDGLNDEHKPEDGHILPSVTYDPAGDQVGTWHWMGFQLGQAAKTDTVLDALADLVTELTARVTALELMVARPDAPTAGPSSEVDELEPTPAVPEAAPVAVDAADAPAVSESDPA